MPVPKGAVPRASAGWGVQGLPGTPEMVLNPNVTQQQGGAVWVPLGNGLGFSAVLLQRFPALLCVHGSRFHPLPRALCHRLS